MGGGKKEKIEREKKKERRKKSIYIESVNRSGHDYNAIDSIKYYGSDVGKGGPGG